MEHDPHHIPDHVILSLTPLRSLAGGGLAVYDRDWWASHRLVESGANPPGWNRLMANPGLQEKHGALLRSAQSEAQP